MLKSYFVLKFCKPLKREAFLIQFTKKNRTVQLKPIQKNVVVVQESRRILLCVHINLQKRLHQQIHVYSVYVKIISAKH